MIRLILVILTYMSMPLYIVLARAGQAGWLITVPAGEVLRVEFAGC